MPTQEFAIDTKEKERVQVYREHEGGDLTILVNGDVIGSVSRYNKHVTDRDFHLQDGSVLTVKVLNNQVQVLKDDRLLLPVSGPIKDELVATRPESSSQTLYLLTHPRVNTFEAESFEAAWGSVWARLIASVVFFIVPLMIPLLPVIFASFPSFVYTLLRLLVLAIILSIGIFSTFFIMTSIPYGFARLFGGRGPFMIHSYLYSLFFVPLMIIPLVIAEIVWIIAAFSSPYNLPSIVYLLSLLFFLLVRVYYFVLQIPALRAVHNLKVQTAIAVAVISEVAIWIALSLFSAFFFAVLVAMIGQYIITHIPH